MYVPHGEHRGAVVDAAVHENEVGGSRSEEGLYLRERFAGEDLQSSLEWLQEEQVGERDEEFGYPELTAKI